MTAHWLSYRTHCWGKVSNRIINECVNNRVVYDISGKPPATIEWNELTFGSEPHQARNHGAFFICY